MLKTYFLLVLEGTSANLLTFILENNRLAEHKSPDNKNSEIWEDKKCIPIPGKGKILVMDDEELLRDIVGMMLEQIGYEVEFANDGSEAIEVYTQAKKSRVPFDAVLMDLNIRDGMGGREAIKILHDIDPGIKAIVTSGLSKNPVMSAFRGYGFSGIISKPYKMKELSGILDKVITEKANDS